MIMLPIGLADLVELPFGNEIDRIGRDATTSCVAMRLLGAT
ncbi:MAG: hypothetical protein R2695_19775 [Acidimicrobiales bacterium]